MRKSNILSRQKKDKNSISISVPRHLKGKFSIPLLDFEELEFRYEHKDRGTDYFKSFILEQRENNVLKFLLELPSPFFLGLDRKIYGNDPFETNFHSKRLLSVRRRSPSHYHRIIAGNLGSGLIEVQDLLLDVMKQIRRVSDRENEKQRNNLILSSFKYTQLSDVFPGENDFTIEEGLLGRRDELESTLKQMGMFDAGAEKEISKFFASIQRLLDEKKEEGDDDKGWDIEWLINKAQINRIYEFLQIIDNAKNKMDKASNKLNKFLGIVNSYYNESGKHLIIDP